MIRKTVSVLALAALAAGQPLLAETPDKFVRYVESTGSQWVDTGVTGRWNTKIEAQVEWMNFADSSFVGSGSNANNTRLYLCYTYKYNTESALDAMTTCVTGRIATVMWNSGWVCRWEKNRVYDYVAELSATNAAGETASTIKVDGLGVWNKAGPGIDTGVSLYVFANHKDGSTVNAYSKTRCYRMKIWQGPKDGGDRTLVRDLIPCMKNGRAGLWDAVSGDILYSGSGTDLVCDENSEVPDEFVEYVESTSLAYVDTEVAARSGTAAECDVAILNRRTRDKGLLEAYTATGGGTRYYLVHSYQGTVTCGSGSHRTTGANYVVGRRYRIESSLAAGSQVLAMAEEGAATATTIYSDTDAATIDTGLSLYLFGCNKDGEMDYGGIYRLYGLTIRQDGVLVRDFRPCLKNGEFALFDNVSKRIFHAKRGLLNGPVRQERVNKRNPLVFVEYIESSGNETLDTGVRARAGTRAKGEFSWVDLRDSKYEENRYLEKPVHRTQRAYLSADDPAEYPTCFHMVITSNRKMWNGYGNNANEPYWAYANDGSSDITMTAGTKYAFDASFMDGEQTVELDGTQVWSLDNGTDFDSGKNLHLFSTGSRYRSAARCYGLEIWQDGERVRDFKPCIYEGKAMLYDTISKTVFRPSPDIPSTQTGGMVVTGDEWPVNYVDYVESDGTVFIDTDVVGKSGTKADLKMQFLAKGDLGFLDARSGNDRFYLWHNYTSQNIYGIGYGAFQSIGSSGSGKTGTDYEVRTSFCTGALSLAVNGQTWTDANFNRLDKNVTVDTGLDLYVFAMDQDGAPTFPGAARLYYLKLFQGNPDGSDMTLVRNFKPVRLSNGIVALWDFKNKKAYLPQLVSSPGTTVQFPSVGPDGDPVAAPFVLVVR